jgi:rhamnose utilization protein RhaD (predicted bifunctional aldolase and dehydrogenase)
MATNVELDCLSEDRALATKVDLEQPLERLRRAEESVIQQLQKMRAVPAHPDAADETTLRALLQNVVVARRTYETLALIVEQASKRQAGSILADSIKRRRPRSSD